MIPGLDVHAGYGLIDWNLVASSGIRFAYLKCSQGNERPGKDPTYERNVQRARAAGVFVGAYHFGYPLPWSPDHPGRTPLEQAHFAYDACGGLGSKAGELSPCVDVEWPPPEEWVKWGVSAAQASAWFREYCEAASLLWGRLPVIYTYPWWWKALSAADVAWAARYPLWMASYTHSGPGTPADGKRPPVPAPWQQWDVWQYSAEGSPERIPGISACPLDRDCIRNEGTLLRLIGRSTDDEVTQTELAPPVARPMATFPIVHPGVYSDDDEPDDAA